MSSLIDIAMITVEHAGCDVITVLTLTPLGMSSKRAQTSTNTVQLLVSHELLLEDVPQLRLQILRPIRCPWILWASNRRESLCEYSWLWSCRALVEARGWKSDIPVVREFYEGFISSA
jgi:hypothetical protein